MGAFDQPEIILQLDSVGEIGLRLFTAGDTENFFAVVTRKDIPDKDFVQGILLHQLVTSTISKETFQKIPDEDLKKIAEAFIENDDYTFKGYLDTGDIFLDFRKPITQYVEQEKKRFQEIHASTIKYTERLSEELKRSGILNINLSVQNYIDQTAISKANQQISTMLAGMGKLPALSLQDAVKENIKAIAPFNDYWKSYYAINEKITKSVLSAFSAQMLSSQKALEQTILEASRLSIKNENIFVGNVRAINTYPETQKTILYKEARIRFFSISDFEAILQDIKQAIETNSQLMFWKARTREILVDDPERIAQGLMMTLLYMKVPDRKVLAFQQLRSGSGIIDILLTFANKYGELEKIILELKVFGKGHSLNDGFEQTAQYMENEETEYGYRVIFNAKKEELAPQCKPAKNGKHISDFIININLPNPSSLD